jgi:hypothetical protein
MRRYAYVGPPEIRDGVAGSPGGREIHVAADLLPSLVKEDWFECAVCREALPRSWNFT